MQYIHSNSDKLFIEDIYFLMSHVNFKTTDIYSYFNTEFTSKKSNIDNF